MSSGGAHRDWLLDLSKSNLRDEDAEGVLQNKVALHRRQLSGKGDWLEYQEIDVSQNQIAWRGCKAIVDACLQCQELKVVKLFKNELTDQASPSICQLVEECPQLEQLHLSYNQLTEKGAGDIISAAIRGRSAGGGSARPGEKRERRDKGFTLWLRLEHNRIRNPDKLLEELYGQHVDFCEARDPQKCGPRVCKRGATVHLPYFSKQDADDAAASSAASNAMPSVIDDGVGAESSGIVGSAFAAPLEAEASSPGGEAKRRKVEVDAQVTGLLEPPPGNLGLMGGVAPMGGFAVVDPYGGIIEALAPTELAESATNAGTAALEAPVSSVGSAWMEDLPPPPPPPPPPSSEPPATAPDRGVNQAAPAAVATGAPAPAQEKRKGGRQWRAPSSDSESSSESPTARASSSEPPKGKDRQLKQQGARRSRSDSRSSSSRGSRARQRKARRSPSYTPAVRTAEETEESKGTTDLKSANQASENTKDLKSANQTSETKEVKTKGGVKEAEEAKVAKEAKPAKDVKETSKEAAASPPPEAPVTDTSKAASAAAPRGPLASVLAFKPVKVMRKNSATGLVDTNAAGKVAAVFEELNEKDAKEPEKEEETRKAEPTRAAAKPSKEQKGKDKEKSKDKEKDKDKNKDTKRQTGSDDHKDRKEPKDAGKPKDTKDKTKDRKEPKDAGKSKDTKDKSKEKDKEKDKDQDKKRQRDSKDPKDRKDEHKSKFADGPPKLKSKADDPPSKAEPKADSKELKGQAKGVAGLDLGNLGDLQRRLEDERNKLRLWIWKAKQDWEEREEARKASGEARGETNMEEYYICSDGEIFGPASEFKAEGSIGKGVFSSVFRCKNTKYGGDFAVKFIRKNHMMQKGAEREVEMYRKLQRSAPKEDAEGCQYLMFLSQPESFIHQGHLCMIFELQKCDLRTALQRYGQGRGLPLQTVQQYSKQLFMALRVLRTLKIIHGDLKPDNLLMSMAKTEIKICDFGSAMEVSEKLNTSYMQPRYYRAPEVMIGNNYDTQIDLWSAGVTLFELGTGRILFTGRSNNMMLRQVLEVCGAIPKRMACGGSYSDKHFNNDGDFLHHQLDSITGQPEVVLMKRFVTPPSPVQGMLDRVLKEPPPNADTKTQERLLPKLAELVAKCLKPDMPQRFTPDQALSHRFFKKDGK